MVGDIFVIRPITDRLGRLSKPRISDDTNPLHKLALVSQNRLSLHISLLKNKVADRRVTAVCRSGNHVFLMLADAYIQSRQFTFTRIVRCKISARP